MPTEAAGSRAVPLTGRELLVLQLLARGYTDDQITTVLGSTRADVGSMATRAAGRLGTTSRREAAAIVRSRGLIV